MSLSTLFRPLRLPRPSQFPCQCTNPIFRDSPILQFTRNATSLSQGRANGAKNGPGKRLGAKKGSEEYVIPGNIIFRQRGTLWHPGENVAMGRDHTIYATQPGYVKFYKDPERHPKRRYIGVVFERRQTLPVPPNAARRRRLGMLAIQSTPAEQSLPASGTLGLDAEAISDGLKTDTRGGKQGAIKAATKTERAKVPQLVRHVNEKSFALRPGYSFREGNWEIGKMMEKAEEKVRPFKKGSRFLAWRKAAKRKAKNAENRGMRKAKK